MATTYTDRWGVPVQAADGGAVLLLDQALEDLVALSGDPVGGAEAAIAAGGELALARIYRAYLSLYATTAEGVGEASALIKPLEAGPHGPAAGPLPPREGPAPGRRTTRPGGTCRPCGRSAWKRTVTTGPRRPPRGTHSRATRKTCGGVHALAHVFEMEGRHQPGVSFLSSSSPDWEASYFAVHNWWHLGLYLLELGRAGDALALFHERIRAARSTEWLDLVDAAALLWRLSLYGTDVAAPAAALAADISDLVDVPVYLFNDWHAVMTFGLAGDQARNGRILAANRHLAAPANRQAAERAGLRLLEGFAAFLPRCANRAASTACSWPTSPASTTYTGAARTRRSPTRPRSPVNDPMLAVSAMAAVTSHLVLLGRRRGGQGQGAWRLHRPAQGAPGQAQGTVLLSARRVPVRAVSPADALLFQAGSSPSGRAFAARS